MIYVILFYITLFIPIYAWISIILLVLVLFSVLDKLGKGVVLRELIALHLCFVCLIMPMITYEYFSADSLKYSRFFKFMAVSEDRYFQFALPAVLCFIIPLTWPMTSRSGADEGPQILTQIERIKATLTTAPDLGLKIIAVGLAALSITAFVPTEVNFVFLLLYWAAFSGLLYVYYTPNLKYKKLIIASFIAFVMFQAIKAGMFTIIAYMGITIFSLFFLGKRMGLLQKVLIFLGSVMFVIVLQSVKNPYRNATWKSSFTGNKSEVFVDLFVKRLSEPKKLFTKEFFFPINYRMNQGFNVSLVMRRIPSVQPHDYGTNFSRVFASSLVPRVLWPDKPEAGGKFNMKYYAGVSIRGWSTNIGPLGEAYGAFGVAGGVIFMFFLGLLIRMAYYIVFRKATKIPLLIFWVPVLFYQITYSAETDTLQILNSLIKSAFLVWMLTKITPGWFGLSKLNQHTSTSDAYAQQAK